MFRVTNQPIDLNELVRYVADPEAGAIVPFIGTTRNNNEGRKVIALDYDGYPEMAEKELARIGAEAKNKWPICKMAIVTVSAPCKSARRASSSSSHPHTATRRSRPVVLPSRKSKKPCRFGRRKSSKAVKFGSARRLANLWK